MPSLADGDVSVGDEGGRGRWSRLHLVVFRFVFSFIAMYALDLIASFVQRQQRLLNGDYPKPFLEGFTTQLWGRVVPWVGLHILHLAHPVEARYVVGQDSVYEYILRGIELVIAIVAGVVWTVLDRRRGEYRDLDAWLRIVVGAVLAGEGGTLHGGG